MTTYKYPKPQTLVQNTLFIMQERFDSGKHVKYVIDVLLNNEVSYRVTFSHDKVKHYTQTTPSAKMRKNGLAQGKPFIKVPVTLGTIKNY